MSLYADVLKSARRWRLFDGARAAVVAVSGGPDSVCLLDLLALMRERGDLTLSLHAAHLNHRLRGAESDADEAFVRELCNARGLPLTVETCDVNAVRADRGGSLEEAAREERYAFLSEAAQETEAEVVAVGHTADDQIETVLHRIIRGAGLKGLRGMSVSRLLGDGSAVRLVRPLLGARRAAVLEHLAGRGLSFREDASNADTRLTRNRLRHRLLPLIESEYNPAFGESLLRLARSAADAYELTQDVAYTAASDCVDGGRIDVSAFGLVHGAARPLLIDAAVAAVRADAPQFDADHYDAIVDLAFAGRDGARIDLPGGLAAVRSGEAVEFLLRPDAEEPAEVEAVLNVPGQTEVPGAGLTVEATVLPRSGFDLAAFLGVKTRYDEVLDLDAAGGPLVLRSRRPGDRFRPLGGSGHKTVGDFLTDLKVPAAERRRTWVVTAAGRPVWVVGYRLDNGVKVTEKTKRLLHLSVTQGRGLE